MELFIDTVRKYPCLWNTTTVEYKDHELKDSAWAEVMKETNLASVKDAKLKWKKLRDSYRDALKRQSEMLAKDPNNPARKNYPWKYMSLMQFLQPHMNNRKKLLEPQNSSQAHHYVNGNDGQTETDSESEEGSSPKRKHAEQFTIIDKKLDFLCKVQTKKVCTEAHHEERKREPIPSLPDPLDIFFNSMCQATKRLPYPAQIKIKKTLFNCVIEGEENLVAEQQNYASLWAQGAMSSSSSEAGAEEEERKPFCS